MPAAKCPPAKANFVDPPYPSSAQQVPNYPNFEPPTTPCPSGPGKVQSESSKVDHQQHGQPAFKGSDSNKQSNANKEFSHYYSD
eukprot:12841676-Alexandrium_andersonii.AAC.1